jgi:RHS repeat-associated protein
MRQTDFGPFNIRNLLYDGTDLVSMYNATGNVMHRYVFGPGIDEPIVWYEGPVTGAKTWLFADHLGSIVALDGSSTGIKTYGPYGEPLPASAAGDRFRYTGQQMVSELGLYYYKARFYSPALGRFLQTDPVGYQSDLNLYAYVGNDPVNLTDPTGTIGINLGAAGIGAIIGGVSAGITAYGNGASPLGIGASILIGAGTGAASGFAVGPIAAIVTSGLAGGYGNLISQKFTSDKDTNFGDAGVAILTSAGGGAASVLAKAGGFGTAVQAGFGGSVTAISQGLVDLRAAANNNYPASGMVLNNPNNISVNNFSSMPVSRSGGYIKP